MQDQSDKQSHAEEFPTLEMKKVLEIGPGTKVDNYVVVRELGVGGMGSVYLAQHAKMKSRFNAIKFLKNLSADQHLRDRFQAEMLAMEKLKHQNIVFAFDAGEFQGHDYLVMELVEGSDLSGLVKQHGPLTVGAAAELIRQAANGLQHAHENGLVHRDIKPSNMMLSSASALKILDLGLASNQIDPNELTVDSQILGTPDYMAPEQWKNTKDVDIRADIYSLGCTLYYLLVGNAPFQDEEHSSLATKMHGHIAESIDLEPLKTSSVPTEIVEVLEKMLAKNRAERIQTPAEVSAALAQLARPDELTKITGTIEKFDAEKETTRFQASLLETNQKLKTDGQQPTTMASDSTRKLEMNVGCFKSSLFISISLVLLIGLTTSLLMYPFGRGAEGVAFKTDESKKGPKN